MNEINNPYDLLIKAYESAEIGKKGEVTLSENALPTDQLQILARKFSGIKREVPPGFKEWVSQQQVEADVQLEVSQAYERFFNHLADRGVHPAYLEELKHVISLADISISVSDRLASETRLKTKEVNGQALEDPTSREINLRLGSMFNRFEQFKKLPIFEGQEDQDLLKMTVDSLIYHEMAHCLQQAFRNHNGTMKSAILGYLLVGPQLHDSGSHRFEHSTNSKNMDEMMEAERQAEGMANDFLLSDLGFDEGKEPTIKADYQQVQYWLRRKGFQGEAVTDDPLLKNLRNVIRAIVTHGSEVSFNDMNMALRKKVANFPEIRKALEQTNVAYIRGLYFPAKRESLAAIYNQLRLPPTNSQPARVEF